MPTMKTSDKGFEHVNIRLDHPEVFDDCHWLSFSSRLKGNTRFNSFLDTFRPRQFLQFNCNLCAKPV